MATDSSWDTYTEPPKGGMGTWAKVFIGCGVAALLLLGGCVGFALWVRHSGKDAIVGYASAKISARIEAPWSKMVEVAEAIKTDEGALKLYDEHHRLAANCPSKEAFLKQVAAWRPVLSKLPTDPPSPDWMRSGRFRISQQKINGTKFLKILFEVSDGEWVTLDWEDDELVGIDLG